MTSRITTSKILTSKGDVSAALHLAEGDVPLFVLAHGAGGDMNNTHLVSFAEGLVRDGVSCLRFNFPFSEQKRRSVDRSSILIETWTLVLREARQRSSRVWIGGKSMGGRYASMIVAEGEQVHGLVLLGYPLHAPGKTDRLRADHWPHITVPTLFIQGTSDPMARWDLFTPLVKKMPNFEVHPVEGGGHSFETKGSRTNSARKSTGTEIARVAAQFIAKHS